MNTYSFNVKDMFVKLNFSGYTNFVTRVRWEYKATNEVGVEATTFGISQFNQFTGDTYVNYSALTESAVINWIESTQDIVKLKQRVDKTIENRMKSPIQNLPLPW